MTCELSDLILFFRISLTKLFLTCTGFVTPYNKSLLTIITAYNNHILDHYYKHLLNATPVLFNLLHENSFFLIFCSLSLSPHSTPPWPLQVRSVDKITQKGHGEVDTPTNYKFRILSSVNQTINIAFSLFISNESTPPVHSPRFKSQSGRSTLVAGCFHGRK